MKKKVLVTYGSKYGATAEIAEKIAEVLTASGADADVMDVKRVKSLGEYNAVVIGSAVYIGAWRREMTRFVEKYSMELAQKLVWVFASGSTGESDPIEKMGERMYPPKLKPTFNAIMPVEITAFHGALFEDKLSGFEKWIIKKVEAPMGDYRDWNMITAWAKEIATKI